MRLFDRAVRVQVDTKLLEGLAVEFRVDRSLSANPNTADLVIRNLSPENRAYLQSVKKPVVKIQAGYRGDDPTDPDSKQPALATGKNPEPPLIFLGEMREVTNLQEGTDWLTRITTGDGDEALKSTVNFSLGPDTSLLNALKRMAADMGVGEGNLVQALSKAANPAQFLNSFVARGQAKEEMARVLKSVGFEYSVQNGDLQVLPIGQPANNTAILLRPSSGLVGSPELSSDKKTKQPLVKARSLLTAKIFPGSKVKIESESINAFFRVQRAVHHGGTHGNDYYVDFEATAL